MSKIKRDAVDTQKDDSKRVEAIPFCTFDSGPKLTLGRWGRRGDYTATVSGNKLTIWRKRP